ERAPAPDAGPPPEEVPARLAAAVVELRKADDAAAGDLWPAGIGPAVPAAAEQRGYVLSGRLAHGR
ncbi:hypothetical protein KSNIM_03740, partial [Kitasatospora sp. DSM 101779]|nr:hypothetical protein [Kitasatospora sp. DSM 101779]